MKRILLLEDDLSLSEGLTFALEKQGYAVRPAYSVEQAASLWREEKHDLLILDISLPDGSGFDFCKSVRQASAVPILFLTAKDEETSVVMGLDMGGDDYVTKPFKLGILLSRVNALLRRGGNGSEAAAVLTANGVTMDLPRGQTLKNGRRLELTGVEYRLLSYLMQNPNRVLSKEQVYRFLWDCDENYVDDNTLSVYIRRLRLKLEDDPEHPEKIVTVRGLGYQWRVCL